MYFTLKGKPLGKRFLSYASGTALAIIVGGACVFLIATLTLRWLGFRQTIGLHTEVRISLL